MSLKVHTKNCNIDTLTKEKTTVLIKISYNCKVLSYKEDKIKNIKDLNDPYYNAIYKIDNIVTYINALIESFFREYTITMYLEKLFESKVDLTNKLIEIINDEICNYGYILTKLCITDIDPNQNVKDAMNEVISSENRKIASIKEAEGKRQAQLLTAEADVKSLILFFGFRAIAFLGSPK